MFKVGSAYVVIAFVLAEAADLVLPTFNAPSWVTQTIFFVLALGFPVAVLLAWAFELTPSGIKFDANAQSIPSLPEPEPEPETEPESQEKGNTSEKYSCSESDDRFTNGKTAMDASGGIVSEVLPFACDSGSGMLGWIENSHQVSCRLG